MWINYEIFTKCCLFQVKAFLEERNSPLFSMDIVSWFPGLKGGRVWKEDHDLLLLQAVLKYAVLSFSSDLFHEVRK